jgi:hypothetical protein
MALKIDGFDSALIGISTVWQRQPQGGATQVDTLIYNGDLLVKVLVEQSGLSSDEAMEYIDYNILGAYVGENTPIICWPCDMEKVSEIVEEKESSGE